MTPSSIALNRFGLGAASTDSTPADPKEWLAGQVARYVPRPQPLATVPATADAAAALIALQDLRRQLRAALPPAASAAASTPPTPEPGAMAPSMAGGMAPAPAKPPRDPELKAEQRDLRQRFYNAPADARLAAALVTDTPFMERMVHFWSNHFTVSADKETVTPLAGAFEVEAIRPHVTGRFGDMLSAAAHHPAMLLYLDQAVSVGPDSIAATRAAMRGRTRGLNENLGREILELHTLGVGSGYTQADVTEFARALTGWTVTGMGAAGGRQVDAAPGQFVFVPGVHEPGARTILGKSYREDGERQAASVLADLAVHPATARHLATKLARHFGGDQPQPAMVARIEAAFLRSNGDLPTVYRAIIASPEAWAPQPLKFRTPWEWAVASLRATGQRAVPPNSTVGLMNQLGQPMWKPGQPNGFDDIAGSWAGPDAVMRRVEAAARIAARAGPLDARTLAGQLYPGSVSDMTAQSIARAESPGQGLALLLVSPEAMRR